MSIDAALVILGHELRDRIDVVRDWGDVPPVQCYPQEIGQVFMNLLVNAAQAIDGRGTITIRTRVAGSCAQIEIDDTGSGIAAEHVDRIFEPGFTTKGERVGMGLGLLIARQVIDRHRGRIAVRSEPGRGSTFSVQLPLRLDAGGNP
jgi:signal transduction histidine kinase